MTGTTPAPPPGFFQFTRWHRPPETFPAWRTHFAAIGIRFVVVARRDGKVALFREGREARAEGTGRVRAWRQKVIVRVTNASGRRM